MANIIYYENQLRELFVLDEINLNKNATLFYQVKKGKGIFHETDRLWICNGFGGDWAVGVWWR